MSRLTKAFCLMSKIASAPTASFNLGTHSESTVFPVASIIGILFGQQQNVAGP